MKVLGETSELINSFTEYRDCRLRLVRSLDIGISHRDPLSEFAEVLVAKMVGGDLARNRVQKGWDILTDTKERVQVKYLANPSRGSWMNWHTIVKDDGWDWYALVVYLDLLPRAVYFFPNDDFTEVCKALGKRHGDQDCTLQFTKTNHQAISADPEKYEKLGMKVVLL